MKQWIRRLTAFLTAVILLLDLAGGGEVLAANPQKTNKNANIGVVYWWSYGDKVDWLADGYSSRASIFYDKKDGNLTYCGNQEKSFSTDRDTNMSKTSASSASAIDGLEWLDDLDRKYRAAFILEYGYGNTASSVEQELESSDTPMWKYGVTQLLIWANAKGYWDDASHMAKIRKNATTKMGVDASSATIGKYWDGIVSSVNTAMAKALKSPTNRHAGLIIYTGVIKQQEQIALSVDFTINTGEAYVVKSSAETEVTEGNSQYVLQGTQYGIYLTEADAIAHSNEVAKLTVDADGTTEHVTLEAGRTYWYSEIKAGTGYLKDTSAKTPVSFTVGKGKTKKIKAQDAPIASTADVQIRKTSGGALVEKGQAIFRVDYFAAEAGTVMEEAKMEPDRTWFFATDQGVLELRNTDRLVGSFAGVESDGLFTDTSGSIVLPLGTIRVREVQAPEGYLATDQEFFGSIKVNRKKTDAAFAWVGAAEGALSFDAMTASVDNEEDRKPQIRTSAVSEDTGGHIGAAGTEVRIKDTVRYENLTPGQTYEIQGKLVVSGSGEPYLDAGGQEVTAVSEPFTIQEGEGSGMVEMWFLFDGSNLDGMKVTACEDLLWNGEVIASHDDPEDEEQTVQFPSIRTSAHLEGSDERTILAEEEVTIIDTVAYRNLKPGETYTLQAMLIRKDAEEMVAEHGEALMRSVEFTPQTTDGTQDVVITFDASDLGGSDLVVYELLMMGNVGLAFHTDLEDADQTIHVQERMTDLTVTKTVQGSGGSKTKAFSFTLHMSYKGQPLEGVFTAFDQDGTVVGPVAFENGTAGFLLWHGQSITIMDLPVHTTYEITEDNGPYVTEFDHPEGVLTPEGVQVHCVNTLEEIVPTGTDPFVWKIPAGIGLSALALLLGIEKWKKLRLKPY